MTTKETPFKFPDAHGLVFFFFNDVLEIQGLLINPAKT